MKPCDLVGLDRLHQEPWDYGLDGSEGVSLTILLRQIIQTAGNFREEINGSDFVLTEFLLFGLKYHQTTCRLNLPLNLMRDSLY